MSETPAKLAQYIFPLPDLEDIARKFDVEVSGQKDGMRDYPPSTAVVPPDGAEKELVTHFRKLLHEVKQQVQRHLHSIREHLGKVDITNEIHSIKAVPQDCKTRVGQVIRDRHAGLAELYEVEKEGLRSLNLFCTQHDRLQSAQYPESRILHASIIALLLLGETIGNAYFFGLGNEMGWLGGALQALVISITNVGISLFFGMVVMRYCHHIDYPKQLAAFGGMAAYIAILITFNLLVAHYRAKLEFDPVTAFFKAIEAFRQDILGINSFDAWILLCMGILSGVVALVDGYKSDDPYPGYGSIHRRHVQARKAYEEGKARARADLVEVIQEALAGLNRLGTELRAAVHSCFVYLNEAKQLEQSYGHHVAALQEGCIGLLNRYRKNNQAVRKGSSAPPPYFGELFAFGAEAAFPRVALDHEEATLTTMKAFVNEGMSPMMTDVQAQVRAINDEALDNVERYIRAIGMPSGGNAGPNPVA